MRINLKSVGRKIKRPLKKYPLIWILLILLVITWFLLRLESNLRPVAMQMAASRAQYWASAAIVRAVEQVISDEHIGYSDLIDFEKDGGGNITAVKTDIARLNRLKNTVATLALEEIGRYETGEVKVPLGNIINGEFLSGRGPLLSVRIIPIGYATTEIENVFEDAGINQTRHRILLKVSAEMTVLIAGRGTSVSVSNEVCVAETVIVGRVPENYTLITDTETYDKYNNFIGN